MYGGILAQSGKVEADSTIPRKGEKGVLMTFSLPAYLHYF
jgi:hypothetical protein